MMMLPILLLAQTEQSVFFSAVGIMNTASWKYSWIHLSLQTEKHVDGTGTVNIQCF